MSISGNYNTNTAMMSSGNIFIDNMYYQCEVFKANYQRMYAAQQQMLAAMPQMLANYSTVQNYRNTGYTAGNFQVGTKVNNPFSNPTKNLNNDSKLNATFYKGQSGAGVNKRVDTKCGKTAEELNKHLSGVLAGKGAVFLEAERRYGVNAAFLIAVCNLESGNGTSRIAVELNNVAGIGGTNPHSYASVDECILKFAKIISQGKYYFTQGKKTLAQIGPTYCTSDSSWAGKVSGMMSQIA